MNRKEFISEAKKNKRRKKNLKKIKARLQKITKKNIAKQDIKYQSYLNFYNRRRDKKLNKALYMLDILEESANLGAKEFKILDNAHILAHSYELYKHLFSDLNEIFLNTALSFGQEIIMPEDSQNYTVTKYFNNPFVTSLVAKKDQKVRKILKAKNLRQLKKDLKSNISWNKKIYKLSNALSIKYQDIQSDFLEKQKEVLDYLQVILDIVKLKNKEKKIISKHYELSKKLSPNNKSKINKERCNKKIDNFIDLAYKKIDQLTALNLFFSEQISKLQFSNNNSIDEFADTSADMKLEELLEQNLDPYTLEIRGKLALRQKNLKKAKKFFDQTLKYDPFSINARIGISKTETNLKERIKILEEILVFAPDRANEIKPDLADAYFSFANLQTKPEDKKNSIFLKRKLRLINRALDYNPNQIQLRILEAKTNIELNSYKRAIINSEKAIELDSKNYEALYYKALALEKDGQHKKAYKFSKRAKRIYLKKNNDISPKIWFSLAKQLINKKKYKSALNYLEAILPYKNFAAESYISQIHFRQAKKVLNKKKHRKAIKHFEKALSYSSNKEIKKIAAEAFYELGHKIYNKRKSSKNLEEAIYLFEKSIALAKNSEVSSELANAYLDLASRQESDQRIKSYTRALELNRYNAEAWYLFKTDPKKALDLSPIHMDAVLKQYNIILPKTKISKLRNCRFSSKNILRLVLMEARLYKSAFSIEQIYKNSMTLRFKNYRITYTADDTKINISVRQGLNERKIYEEPVSVEEINKKLGKRYFKRTALDTLVKHTPKIKKLKRKIYPKNILEVLLIGGLVNYSYLEFAIGAAIMSLMKRQLVKNKRKHRLHYYSDFLGYLDKAIFISKYYSNRRLYAHAMSTLDSILYLEPENKQANYQKGQVLEAQGKFKEAYDCYRKVRENV